MSDDIITLMIVETPDSKILAESPPVRNATTGMTAMIGDIRGVISMLTLTHRGSVEYEMAKALAGRVYRVTGIFMPWDTPTAK